MEVVIPATVGPEQIVSTNMAEPGPGEVVYNSADPYSAGDEVISLSTHRRYRAAAAVPIGRDPATDTIFPPVWVDVGPTNRYAAFDQVISTKTFAGVDGEITYTLAVGYFGAIYINEIDAGNLEITVKDAPGGHVIYHYDDSLTFSEATDWYQYFFGANERRTEFFVSGIEPYNNAEITITITGGAGSSVGAIALGQNYWLGDTVQRAKSKLVDYTRYTRDEFGNLTVILRPSSNDMTALVWFPISQAVVNERVLKQARGKVCLWAATDAPEYIGLRAYGIGSFSTSYDDPSIGWCTLSLDVTGVI